MEWVKQTCLALLYQSPRVRVTGRTAPTRRIPGMGFLRFLCSLSHPIVRRVPRKKKAGPEIFLIFFRDVLEFSYVFPCFFPCFPRFFPFFHRFKHLPLVAASGRGQVLSALRKEDGDADGRLDPFEVSQALRKLLPQLLGCGGDG